MAKRKPLTQEQKDKKNARTRDRRAKKKGTPKPEAKPVGTKAQQAQGVMLRSTSRKAGLPKLDVKRIEAILAQHQAPPEVIQQLRAIASMPKDQKRTVMAAIGKLADQLDAGDIDIATFGDEMLTVARTGKIGVTAKPAGSVNLKATVGPKMGAKPAPDDLMGLVGLPPEGGIAEQMAQGVKGTGGSPKIPPTSRGMSRSSQAWAPSPLQNAPHVGGMRPGPGLGQSLGLPMAAEPIRAPAPLPQQVVEAAERHVTKTVVKAAEVVPPKKGFLGGKWSKLAIGAGLGAVIYNMAKKSNEADPSADDIHRQAITQLTQQTVMNNMQRNDPTVSSAVLGMLAGRMAQPIRELSPGEVRIGGVQEQSTSMSDVDPALLNSMLQNMG